MERLTFAQAAEHEHIVQPVPAAEAFGIAAAWIKSGQVSATMPIPPDSSSGRHVPPPTLAALVADTACGGAVVSAGFPRPAMTLSLHLDLTDDIPTTGYLHCQARLRSRPSDGPLFVDGVVTDSTDHEIARVTSWWLPGRAGGTLPSLTRATSRSGVDVAPSLTSRFGLRTSGSNGHVTLSAERIERYVNRRSTLHGGVAALLTGMAAEDALASTGSPVGRMLSFSIQYLAPAGSDGTAVDLSAQVVRSGSRFAAVESRVLTADGRSAAVAQSTHWR